MRNYTLLLLFGAIVLISACEKKEILPGKREEIFTTINKNINKTIASLKINATPPSSIDSCVDVAGNKQHSDINHKMLATPKTIWKTKIGRESIHSDPIYIDGKIYAVDALGILNCVSAKDGRIIWKKEIAPQPDEAEFSGGLTAANGVIFISTNTGHLIAINSKTQKEIWNKDLKYPLKGSPLFVNDRIIITTIDNQTLAIDAKNGTIIWSNTINNEQTTMAKFGTPAVYGNDVICAYSSGDVASFSLSSGSDNWSEVLFSSNVSESGFVISHIAASPVVYKNYVLIATSESKMILLDATSGIRVWEQDLGTIHTPIINNNWIFVLTSDNKLVCLSLNDGAIKWQTNITDEFNEKKGKEAIWTGPLMINGKLVIFSDHGHKATFDISTGKTISSEVVDRLLFVRTPMIVNKIMYFITDYAELYAVG
ncbi:MAG: PQQ-like beta-propeller repeat protein [Holosporales bacterium]|nr:PQQ-like beta-propeller repeat protein [Holosporales bacterium]